MVIKKPIAIYGAGGLGKEVLALLDALPEWDVIGFFDDGVSKDEIINSKPILGTIQHLIEWKENLALVLAIGAPKVKRQLSEQLSPCKNLSFPVLIHPRALIMDIARVHVGEGAIITAGSILTTNIKIGKHVLVNLNATIGHDSEIGDYCSVMPGANIAGAVRVGETVLIGSGSNVLSEVTIGNGSVIGAGSVVNHDVGNNVTAVGAPARVIKTK